MEIEVGEYVRLTNGQIDKVKNIIHDIAHQEKYLTIEFEKNVPYVCPINIAHIFPVNIAVYQYKSKESEKRNGLKGASTRA